MAQLYKVDESFDHSLFENSSCAFGVFDGVHRGHRYLLSCAQDTAKETGGQSIALTFDIDPDEVGLPHFDRAVIDRFPGLLSDVLKVAAVDREYDLMVLSSLTVLSTIMPGVSGMLKKQL